MAVTTRSSNLPSIDTQMVDPVTGECSTAWFNFFLSLFNRTGASAGSKSDSTSFLFPTGNGTIGQVLTSQGGQPTSWTDPITEQRLLTDGFVKSADLGDLGVPNVSISIGQQQGSINFDGKLLEFWGEFVVPTNLSGDPLTNSPQVQTVTVPVTVRRLLDISVTPYWDVDVNRGYQLGGSNFGVTVFNYGYDQTTGLYTGRTDGATNKFDVYSQLPGIHRYRGKAEL